MLTYILIAVGAALVSLFIGGLSGALFMYTKLRPRIREQVRKEPEHPIPMQAQLDQDALEEAEAEVERTLRGELDPKVRAKLEAIAENKPEGTMEERWAWAAKQRPNLDFL